jgi:hypothetical protein
LDAIYLSSGASAELLSTRNVTFDTCGAVLPDGLVALDSNSYDLVTAFDLIEHLPKYEGYRLLYEIDRIAVNGCSVVFTPSGFLWQPPSSNNSFNAHLSGWSARELKKLGWRKQIGMLGFKIFMGPYAVLRFQPKTKLMSYMFQKFISVCQILARPFPSLSHAVFAVKTTKNPRLELQDGVA